MQEILRGGRIYSVRGVHSVHSVRGMNVQVVPVAIGEKEVQKNLLEKYDYEFSLSDNRDVNDLGPLRL